MSNRCLYLLNKCNNIDQFKKAHALVITCGLGANPFALSRLLAFCSDPLHANLSYGHQIFTHIKIRTICIYNTMIKGFLLQDENFKVMEVYRLILRDGMCPDNYTLPYALRACGKMKTLSLGRGVHGHGLKLGLGFDEFVGNGLVGLYSSFGEMGAARGAFDEISWRGVASWTVLISGYGRRGDVCSARLVFDEAPLKDKGVWGAMVSAYVQNDCFKEGLGLFRLMQLSGVMPDEGSLVSVLCCCAHLGCLEIGKWVHRYVEWVKIPVSVRLDTALVDMYAKCGCLGLAQEVFDQMPHKDVICWNVMISGYAMNGDGVRAVAAFDEMQRSGVKPDGVTFVSLLTACGYTGMAWEGLNLLRVMWDVYRIDLESEHFGCVVDLLSRARLVKEANELVQRMPMLGSSSEKGIVWRALLNACCNHGQVNLAEAVAERLVMLEQHSGAYVLLANAYAAAGRHDEVRRIRRAMRSRGVEKTPGCSSVEIDGVVHEFVAGEKTHKSMDKICEVLNNIKKQLNSFVLDFVFPMRTP